jgi:hypothetical protein
VFSKKTRRGTKLDVLHAHRLVRQRDDDGSIITNGQNGSGNNSGGGSGGGIRIDVGTISGTGQIRAHGGNSSYSGGAGGGGRIAIYYRDASAFNMSNVTALGGTGGFEGQNGTVFAQQQGALAP